MNGDGRELRKLIVGKLYNQRGSNVWATEWNFLRRFYFLASCKMDFNTCIDSLHSLEILEGSVVLSINLFSFSLAEMLPQLHFTATFMYILFTYSIPVQNKRKRHGCIRVHNAWDSIHSKLFLNTNFHLPSFHFHSVGSNRSDQNSPFKFYLKTIENTNKARYV